jgi:hypothetical protein
MTKLAAKLNFELLEAHDFDFQQLLFGDIYSPTRAGSEFRPIPLLEPIFTGHPLWTRIRRSILHGADFPLRPISEDARLIDLDDALEYGNHKSAENGASELTEMLKKEVQKGWQLPLPIDRLHEITNLILGPIGLAAQMTIDKAGNIIPKNRLTHDQSMAFSSGLPVNTRVIEDELTDCAYGFALRRYIHYIVDLRAKFPDTAILLSKFDFKSAYRRVHLAIQAAKSSVITTKGLSPDPIALMSLRLTFGAAPCPALFSEFSESTTDLANAISRCDSWDPNLLHSHQSHLIGPSKKLPADIPFAPARTMLVDPEADSHGRSDVFIDDIFSAIPAISPDHEARAAQAVLLALAVIGRPVLPDGETLTRDDLLALAKALAEGTPTEELIVTGWEIDSRRLLVVLPTDKHAAWTNDIRAILRVHGQIISADRLKELGGRLQHVACILQEGNHFLSRIRSAVRRADTYRGTRLSKEEELDLALWLKFLDRARAGIDMNLITSRAPNKSSRTDACTYGLGGYSLVSGRAWQFEIPEEFRLRMSINFLEYLACIIGLRLAIHDGEIDRGDCILILGDNTSSLGWLRKSNFAPDGERAVHLALARSVAEATLEQGVCLYTQWFPGKDNWVADLLSRYFQLSHQKLTEFILSNAPYSQQVPANFKVRPLPKEITSEIYFWLRQAPPRKASQPLPPRSPTPHGSAGSSSSTPSDCPTTPSSTTSIAANATDSWVPSPNPCATAPTANPQKDILNWLRAHALPPSTAWLRPSKPLKTTTPGSTVTERLHSFYNVSTKDIKI